MSTGQQRLEITLQHPNPVFEKWLEKWLSEAEYRNTKSKHKLRDALEALRSYPLPLASGRECAILRGFGTTLCNLIDEEISLIKKTKPEINSNSSFQHDVQQVVETVKKATKRKQKSSPNKAHKLTKKEQKELAEEEERTRQVTMSPGSFRILLLVDTQETNGKNKRILNQTRSYLESLAIPYEVRRLTLGDFLWVARDEQGNELVLPYIIERKRMDDLASSIRDGRFHEQKHRLRHCGIENVIYLVEDYGNNEQLGLPLETLHQAISNTQIQSNFIITHTEDHWRSMVYLQGITKTLIRIFKDKTLISTAKEELQKCQPHDLIVGLMKFRCMYEDSAKNSQLSVREVFVQQLLQLHSLSLDKALAIVDKYSTPRLLLDAFETCASLQEARSLLANIKCGGLRALGEKLSQTIYDFYTNEF